MVDGPEICSSPSHLPCLTTYLRAIHGRADKGSAEQRRSVPRWTPLYGLNDPIGIRACIRECHVVSYASPQAAPRCHRHTKPAENAIQTSWNPKVDVDMVPMRKRPTSTVQKANLCTEADGPAGCTSICDLGWRKK